ncbi:MAG: hypothetical protein IJT96_04030 [Lachnospiraceae bacterium]|nr:hypothetical protein [Lachnospiraceae bacterium]
MKQFGRRIWITVLVVLVVFLLAASCIVLWLHGAFLPLWIEWNKDAEKGLPDGVMAKLDDAWLVQDSLNFDINGDGIDEWILLVWKRGSYGPHRPSWVKHDEIVFSQHIFIYTDRSQTVTDKNANEASRISEVIDSAYDTISENGGDWHAIWMSSAMDIKAVSFSIGEEIPGTERLSLDIKSPEGEITRWGWLSWGLTRVD